VLVCEACYNRLFIIITKRELKVDIFLVRATPVGAYGSNNDRREMITRQAMYLTNSVTLWRVYTLSATLVA
jgi:hypothetical protein